MADSTHIEWTDSTWNPWRGCQQVGPGCLHCYAEARDVRWEGGLHFGPRAPRVRASDSIQQAPIVWQREADAFEAQHGRRRRVFALSLGDIFDNAVDLLWTWGALGKMEICDRLEWQLVTKRIGNLEDRVLPHWLTGSWPGNVGLMITVCTQAEADRDVPKLLAAKAASGIPWVGLSVEPLLEAVDLRPWLGPDLLPSEATGGAAPDRGLGEAGGLPLTPALTRHPSPSEGRGEGLDWVIVGGESGPKARPMHPDWARSLRDQCKAAGVPFFFKQWGEWTAVYDRAVEDPDWRRCDVVARETPRGQWLNLEGGQGFHGERVVRVVPTGKGKAGRTLDLATHNGFPEALTGLGPGTTERLHPSPGTLGSRDGADRQALPTSPLMGEGKRGDGAPVATESAVAAGGAVGLGQSAGERTP